MKQLIDNVLETKLNKYSMAGVSLGTNLKLAIEKGENADMVIPVVGTQGMGKSTLINSILQENILPEGADETTCVPVEVRYGKKPEAEVYFRSDKPTAIVHTRDELNEFVDNNYNPANEKQVSHIVLYRDHDLLKKGLIIVDLPGLNSLTEKNGETTMRYMENVGTGIILFNTIPTITQPESVFIKFLWAQFSSVIFVQNRWDTDLQVDVDDAIEYHTKVLSQIASQIKVPFNEKINVINVRSALDGALLKDTQLLESSNISSLITDLQDLAHHWEEVKSNHLNDRVKQAIEASKAEILRLLEEQNLAFEEVVRQRKDHLANHQETTRKLKEKCEDVTIILRQKEDDIYRYARDTARECADDIRNDMYAAIDGGIYDGENLEHAFDKVQQRHVSEYFNKAFNQFQIIQGEVKDKIEEIGNILLENKVDFQTEKANRPRQFKWEQNLDAAMGIIGGLAGLAIGNIWHPGGWILAGVTVVAGLVASVIGFFGKKAKRNNRAKKAKEAISEPITKIEHELRKCAEEEFAEFSSTVSSVLETLLRQRADEESSLESSIYDDNEVDTKELKDDLSYFEQKETELSHV